jgi:energy-coupling factor transport system substrate-specific component
VTKRVPPAAVYALVGVLGAGAFLYPFWLPSEALPDSAHSADAPLVSAVIGAIVIVGVLLEVRSGTMNGAGVAVLGILSAFGGLLRLLDLPGGGSGMFFLIVLAGAGLGPKFGFLLGIIAMAVSAVITGGVGPWMPFQMLALGFMGATSGAVGLLTRHLDYRLELVSLVVWGWLWGFLYGAIMNLWFWPFVRDLGPLSWQPGMGPVATFKSYWSFYVATSLAWDAAGAFANALLIAATGIPVLHTIRRFASRIEPVVRLDSPQASG